MTISEYFRSYLASVKKQISNCFIIFLSLILKLKIRQNFIKILHLCVDLKISLLMQYDGLLPYNII